VSAVGTAPEPSFADRVAAVVASIEAGTVLTYGEVAAEAGSPGAARAVGHVLASRGRELPWWRVVTARGRLVPGLEQEQARRLGAEGVPCGDGAVDRRTVAERPSPRGRQHPA
jgi:methylated-DNA-protein-cysteine methyltransferase related protein